MRWKRIRSKGADSIRSGDFRIHKSGNGLKPIYTVYKMNPFKPIATNVSLEKAKRLALEASEQSG